MPREEVDEPPRVTAPEPDEDPPPLDTVDPPLEVPPLRGGAERGGGACGVEGAVGIGGGDDTTGTDVVPELGGGSAVVVRGIAWAAAEIGMATPAVSAVARSSRLMRIGSFSRFGIVQLYCQPDRSESRAISGALGGDCPLRLASRADV